MPEQRILIVDDDPEIVRLARAYMEQAGYRVFVAYNGETAVHTIRREKPDLLILDLMLPDRNGWDIARLIRADAALSYLPIIMLTARIDDTDKIVGLELGADDYVTKPFNPRELVARVRAVLRRTHPESVAQVLQLGELRLDLGARELQRNGQPVELTPTEFDLLRIFMEHAGYTFTRGELAEKALGYNYAGMERTLDSHVKNLRRKIGDDPKQPAYIQTVYGVGYRLAASRERTP